jgi:serine/threonine protein kinase
MAKRQALPGLTTYGGPLSRTVMVPPPTHPAACCVVLCPGRPGRWGAARIAAKSIFSQMMNSDYGEIESEMRLLHQLKHPNIVTFFGVSYHQGTILLITEYCPTNLEKHVLAGRLPLSPSSQFWRIAFEIATGTAYLHRQGVAHR